ncbi:hypothetical protein B0H66DRAFT_569619 [Apodospora peruviana]|uniref:Uncharacterized protein n=1 Tax=Apodospora peruviana TaxID=516989 RepID=A0AAE0HUG6_9PEZI|nr:hypothetical protein B0H66DRAFT_569619 [Apodospora peruviana]
MLGAAERRLLQRALSLSLQAQSSSLQMVTILSTLSSCFLACNATTFTRGKWEGGAFQLIVPPFGKKRHAPNLAGGRTPTHADRRKPLWLKWPDSISSSMISPQKVAKAHRSLSLVEELSVVKVEDDRSVSPGRDRCGHAGIRVQFR